MPTTTPAGPVRAAAPCAAATITVLIGTLSRGPERRELPSGDTVLGLEVTVRAAEGAAESVNVAWHGAPPAADRWSTGEQVLVTGRTRRRFFRAGGATQSRTEVVASVVVPMRRAAAVRAAVEAAAAELLGALDP